MTVILVTAAIMALPITLAAALIIACRLHDRWCQRQPVSPTVTAWKAETELSMTEALALVEDRDLGWSATPIRDRLKRVHDEFGRDYDAIHRLPEREEP